MSKGGATVNNLLLAVIVALLGLSSWFGYKFADHAENLLMAHEVRLDSQAGEIVALKTKCGAQ